MWKENKEQEKKEGSKEGKEEEKKEEEPQEIVLKVDMHCEACARKVARALKGFEGFSPPLLNFLFWTSRTSHLWPLLGIAGRLKSDSSEFVVQFRKNTNYDLTKIPSMTGMLYILLDSQSWD